MDVEKEFQKKNLTCFLIKKERDQFIDMIAIIANI